ncbi:hypothetical protein JKF63_02025 [Porcisia hertigi]|uniref:Uncharacterized protein n=1 Tax=Porcisia hertigi TaxID=2761500 RepID=A0A836I7G3_9TRYP|nr:hypothetical protein JKF63_02025 [Porcisia hertigi]
MSEVPSKTAVNTRAPLASRLPKIHKEVSTKTAGLHRKIETTYDAAYRARSAVHSADASGTQAAKESVSATYGAPQARAEQTYTLNHHPTSSWESTSHAATRNVLADPQLDFYASVRKVEQKDDDQRGGLVGCVQRWVDIRNKRGNDPSLRPRSPTYCSVEGSSRSPTSDQLRLGLKSSYLDLVECTQLKPETEEQIGYDDAPLTRLPGEPLSQELKVQSKVITHMGTSNEFFRGTPKFLEDTSIGYMGHVPMADRNAALIHHSSDARRLCAKSNMTLAEHGGGVDIAVIGSNLVSRHRRGKNSKAPRSLPPKATDSINRTVEGRMLQQTFSGTLERERQMNIRDDSQGRRYF